MTTLQATIPFKARKKVNGTSRKSKSNENQDTINTNGLPNVNNLKRRIKEDKSLVDEDFCECSNKKISRKPKSDSESTIDDVGYIQNGTSTSGSPTPLTSREKEIEWLERFLMEHIDTEESASLYISGQPGTGKTASLTYILQLPKIQRGYKQVYINCTMMKSATSIYNRICKELQLQQSGRSEKACLSSIEKYLNNKKHKMILLVLDEIDQLDSKRQSVLYTIFEWPSVARSRLVLLGVANALDLTERALPRLQARCALRPGTLHFAPYTKEQIINIFTTVLANEDKTNVFSPVALQMLAAKIAAVSGDMRRALDIGRRVIELAKRSKFSENKSVDSIMKDSTVTVELKQVLGVLNDVYGGAKRIDSLDEGLPMQQKLILCSLMLMLTKGKNKDILMGKLHDVYKRVADARNIAPLDLSEMCGACSLLEARGVLACSSGAGGARGRRVRLLRDEAEMAGALRDRTLLADILRDVRCLAPVS